MSDKDARPRNTKLRIVAVVAAALSAGALVIAITLAFATTADNANQPSWAGARYDAVHHPTFAGHPRMGSGQMMRGRSLHVHAGDYWFTLSTKHLVAGKVTLTAHNLGATVHDVMIERIPIKFSAPGAPIDMAAQGGVDGVAPGTAKTTNVVLTSGRYRVFCSVPDHYGAGQWADLTVDPRS